jgi:chromatin modification-related protein EAF6
MPSYEDKDGQMAEYEKMKKELRELINRKRVMDKNLTTLEDQIYKFEGAYLEDASNGNIMKGYDNYMKTNQTKRRGTFSDQDRLFSLSSAVFLKVFSCWNLAKFWLIFRIFSKRKSDYCWKY